MIRSAILLLVMWCLALLTIALLQSEHKPANAGLPLVKSAAVVVPWALNTRCAVNSKNLPLRDPERNA